jgi:hypothetical protein
MKIDSGCRSAVELAPMVPPFTRRRLAVMAIVTVLAAVALDAQTESKSAAAAKELAQLLEAAKLDSVASKDPAEKDQYVAALYFTGQLLVVSARYSAPTLLDQKISKKEYRDVYIDLNSAAIANSKVFIEDLNADGLRPTRENDQPFDTVEHGAQRLALDGEWKKQKLSETDYMKVYGEMDDRYSKMLAILLAEIKKPTGN